MVSQCVGCSTLHTQRLSRQGPRQGKYTALQASAAELGVTELEGALRPNLALTRTAGWISCGAHELFGEKSQAFAECAQVLVERLLVVPERRVPSAWHHLNLSVGDAGFVLVDDCWVDHRVLRTVHNQDRFANRR